METPESAPTLRTTPAPRDHARGGRCSHGRICCCNLRKICTIQADDGFLVSSAALEMMRKMNYMPGLGLGRNQQGIAEFPSFLENSHHFGLGYVPKKSGKRWRNRARAHATAQKSVVNFVAEEEKALYQGQPEPFLDMESKVKYHGLRSLLRTHGTAR